MDFRGYYQRGQQRQNTTGEYIAYSQTIAGEFYKEGKNHRKLHSETMDLIVANNIDKAISAGYKNMYDTHKRELNNADYDQREAVEAKHTFEQSYFEWQEQNYKKPLDKKDLVGLEAVHVLYQDWMEKSTGLPMNPPFTVEQRTQEIVAKKQAIHNEIKAPKSMAKELSDSIQATAKQEKVSNNYESENKEELKSRVKNQVLQMRMKK